MTNKHTHQIHALVFSSQSRTAIEQILASSGPVQTAQRTESGGVACQPRSHPLDAARDISHVSARLPAGQTGEWPDHLTHIDPRATGNIRTRPDSAPTHSRLSASIGGRASHARPDVTLLRFDSIRKTVSRANIQRPDTGTNPHPSGHTTREHTPIDPDNFRKAFMPAKRPPRGVRQDKARLENARRASRQPALDTHVSRAQLTNNAVVRSQSVAGKQKLVQVTLWVDPSVKEHLERKAREEGLSLSPSGAAFLRKAVQQDTDLQYSALLRPIIEDTIAKSMAGIATRLTWLLVRIAFDAGQTRSLVTNILGRQAGVTPPVLKTLMDNSNRSAKANIMRRTPHITELINSVEQWMTEDSRGVSNQKTHD